MMFFCKTSFVLCSLIFSFHAWAGKEAHGGSGIICRDSNSKIISVRLFDFYEGLQLHGLLLRESSTSAARQIRQAGQMLDRVNSPFSSFHEQTFVGILDNLHFLPSGTDLTPVHDINSAITVPSNCSVVQLAVYLEDGQIYVNQDLWKMLSETDKAGLVVHEGLYYIQRQTANSTDSSRARKLTAHLFSGFPFQSVKSDLETNSWQCASQKNGQRDDVTTFYVNVDNGHANLFLLSSLDGLVYSHKSTSSPLAADLFPFSSTTGPVGKRCQTVGLDSNFEGDQSVKVCVDTDVQGTSRFTISVWYTRGRTGPNDEYVCWQ